LKVVGALQRIEPDMHPARLVGALAQVEIAAADRLGEDVEAEVAVEGIGRKLPVPERPADQVLEERGLARACRREGDRMGKRLLLLRRVQLQAVGSTADGLEEPQRPVAPIGALKPVRLIIEAVETREVLSQQ
jgi:hypothetical protein